jgi:ubiquinone/menaquinone biosynthesis C-methylase UbiE
MGEFLKVNDILLELDTRPDMRACEFGCGSALFTTELAKKLPKGWMYAMDIQEEKLSALKGRMAIENIHNISTILCDLEAPKATKLQDNFLDIVLIPNMLFQAENKYAILEEANRILKNGGQLLIIDWFKNTPFSPKEGTITPEELKNMTSKLGLEFKKEFAAGDYHYGLLFVK